MMLSSQVKVTGCCRTLALGKKTMLQVFAFIFLSINVDSQSLQTLSSSSAVIQPSFNIVSNSTRIANSFLPSSTPLLYNATIYSSQDVQTSIFKESSLASSIFSSNQANSLQHSSSVTHSIAQTSLQQTSILSSQSHSNNKTDYLQPNASSMQNVEQTLLQQTSLLNSLSISNNNSKHLSPIRTEFLQNSSDSSVRTNISTNFPQSKTESLTTLDFRTALSSGVFQTGQVSHAAALSETKIIDTQSSVQPVTSNVNQFSSGSLSLVRPSRSVTSNEASRTIIAESMLSQPQLANSVMYTSTVSETTSVNLDTRLSLVAQSVIAPLRTVVTKSSEFIVKSSSVSSNLLPEVPSSSLSQVDPSMRPQTVGNASGKMTSTLPGVDFSTSFQNTTVISQLRSTPAVSSSIIPQQSIVTETSSSILSSMLVVLSVDKADATGTVDLQTTASMHETSQSLLQATFSFSESKTAITAPQSSRNPLELLSLTQILSISMDASNASQLVSRTPSSSQHSTQDFAQRTTTTATPYQTLSVTSHLMPQSSIHVAFDSQSRWTNGITSATLHTTTNSSLLHSSDEFRIVTPPASVQNSLAAMSTDVLYGKSSYSASISEINVRTSVVTSLSLEVKATPSVLVAESTVSVTVPSARVKRSQNIPSELTTQPLGSAALYTSTLEQSPIPASMLSKSEATLQTTMEAKSSQLPLTASTNEQLLFSSVYPCWIVNTVYMTIDASAAIYPNQTLHKETVIQATKFSDYITQSSTFPAVSSQEALFTGITSQSVAAVVNGSSSIYGVMSTLEVVHEGSTSSLSRLSEPENSYTGAVATTQSVLDERMVSSSSQRLATAAPFFPQPSSSASQITTNSSLVNASPNSTTRAQTSVEPLMTTKASAGPSVYQRVNQSVDSTQFKQSAGGSSSAVLGSMTVSFLTSIGKPSKATDVLQSTVDHQTSASSLGGQSFIVTLLQPSDFPGSTLGSTTATPTTLSLSEHLTSEISVNPSLKATLETPQSTLNVAGDVLTSTSITAMSFHELPSLSTVIQASTMNPSPSAIVDTKVFMPSAAYPETTISSPGSAGFVQSQPLSTDVGQPTSLVKSETSEISTFVNAPAVVNASVTKISALSDSKDQLSTTGSTMYASNRAEIQQQLLSTVSSNYTASETGFPASIALNLSHTKELGSSLVITPNLTATATHQMSSTATSTGLMIDNSVTMTPSFKPPAGSATRSIDFSAVSINSAETYKSSNTVPVLQNPTLTSVESDKSITVTASLTLSMETTPPRSSIFPTSGNVTQAPQISTFIPVLPITNLTSVGSKVIATSSLPVTAKIATSKQPQSSLVVSSSPQAPEPIVIQTPVPLKKRKRRAVNGVNDTSMMSSNVSTSASWGSASLGSHSIFSVQEARSITPTASHQPQLTVLSASSAAGSSYSSNSDRKALSVTADTARLLQSPDSVTSLQPVENIEATNSQFVDPTVTQVSIIKTSVMQTTSTVENMTNISAVLPSSQIVSNKSLSKALSVQVTTGVVSMSLQDSMPSSHVSSITIVSSVSTPSLSEVPLMDTSLQTYSSFNSQINSFSGSMASFSLHATGIASSSSAVTEASITLGPSGVTSSNSQHSVILSSAKSSGSEITYSKGSVSSIGSQIKALATSIPHSLPSLVAATVTTVANESSQNIAISTQRTMDSTPASQPSITSPVEMQHNTSAAHPVSIEVSSSLKTVEQASQSILPGSTITSQSLGGSLTLTGGQTTSDTLKVGSSSNISSLLATISQSESILTDMVPSSRVSSILPSVKASSSHMISPMATASILTSSVGMVSPSLPLSVPQFTTSNFDAFQSQGSPSTTAPKLTRSISGTRATVFSTVEAGSKHTIVGSVSRSSSISLKATNAVDETSGSIVIGSITSQLLSPSLMQESPSQTSSLVSQSLNGNSPSRMMSSAISSSSPNLWTQNPRTTSQQSVVPTKSTTVVAYVTSSLGQCIAYYTPRLTTSSLSTLARPSVVSQLTSSSVQETFVHTASTLLKSTPLVVSSPTRSNYVGVSSDFSPSVQTQHLTSSSTNIIQLSRSLFTSVIHPSTQLTVSYSMSRSVAKSQVADLTSAVSQDMTTSLFSVETQAASLSLTATIAASQSVSSASQEVGPSQSSTMPSLARDASPSVSLSEMSKDLSTVGQDSVDGFTSIPMSTSHVATAILPTTSYALQSVPITITASQALLRSSLTKVATPVISVGGSAFSTSQHFSASDGPVYETTSPSKFTSSVTASLSKPETTAYSTEATPSYQLTTASQQVSTAISTGLRVSTPAQPHTSTVLLLKTSSGLSSQSSSKAPLQTSSILEPPASSSVFPPVGPTASSTKDVIAVSTSLTASSIASLTATSSFIPNAMTSQVPTSTPAVTTVQPVSAGLCDLVLIVAPAIDITSAAFKLDLETKLVETFNKIKLLRKRRAVTQAGTTVNVTSVTRQGSTSNVNVEFYVKENNAVVPAQRTTAVLNQLTVSALSQRLNQTVASPVVAVTASTTTKPTTAAMTVTPPESYQILGMVLTDDASNNISSGNNRALFETRMAQYYRNGKGISSTVNFTISFLVHEVKNIVYLEFYVTVANVRQNATVVAMFYHASNVTVTVNTLSALLGMVVITEPYSISSISASDLFQVKMTIKPSTPTNLNTAQFKNDLAVRITTLYREAKDIKVKRRRRALGSITTTIVSLVTNTKGQATVIFYILDQGVPQNGASVASILNRVATNRMSAVLGVEVITVPAAVAVLPVPAAKSTNYIWIIAVVVGACLLIFIVAACIYWRWKVGGPQRGKLDIEEISMTEKKKDAEKGVPYGGYRDIAKFAEGRSKGGPAMKTTTFTSPPDTDEKPDLSRSMRRKVRQTNGIASRPAGRQNAAYEESEEDDIDDGEDEDDDDDYESEVPALPQKQQVSRPVSAQRRVEVQPGPSRDPKRTVAAMQKTSAASKRRQEEESDDDDDDDDDDSEEDDLSQRVPSTKPAKESQRPAAAELPPVSQMKDVQEAPSYPPVRFRTNIEPETSKVEHLPPLIKTGTSLIGRRLPDIDPDLKQKSDLERSRNKQRQRLRASGRRPDVEKQNEVENTKAERRAWRKAQLDIDSLLDPVAATSRRSPRASNKRARRRHRFRRSHKVDITSGEPQKELDESMNVKLNNYMSLASPKNSVSVDESDDTRTEEDRETNIEEARERIHNLLDDAFTILDPYKRKPSPRTVPAHAPVREERLLEGKEEALSQAPMPEALPQRYRVPALPPPPHGRATAPPPGERKRMFNYSMPPTQMQQTGLTSMNGTQPLTPVVTRDPMVVMDRAEKNRYLSQRLGQSAYGRPPTSFAYTYEKSPSDQPVFITPVQQQPDGLGGVIWSPYTAEVIRDDINSSSAPLFNTMESPAHEQFNMKSTPIMSTPQSQRIRQPHHTSIDMTTSPYASLGYGETPQPLIRAIKDELLRLSQSARGRTQIKELSADEMRRDLIS